MSYPGRFLQPASMLKSTKGWIWRSGSLFKNRRNLDEVKQLSSKDWDILGGAVLVRLTSPPVPLPWFADTCGSQEMVTMEALSIPGAESLLPATVDADGHTKGAAKYAQVGGNAASALLSAAMEPQLHYGF